MKRNLRVEISNREFADHSPKEFPSVSISSNNYRYHNLSIFWEKKKKNKNRPVLEISLYSKSRIGTITSAYFSLVSLSENVKRFPSRDGDPILHVLRVPVCGVRDCDRRPLH